MNTIGKLERLEKCHTCNVIRGRHMLEDNLCFQCYFANLTKKEKLDFKDYIDFTKLKKICIYCGEPGYEKEHVIPRVKGLPSYTVISCNECNHIASGRLFKSLLDKQYFIQNKILDKYEAILDCPEWTDDELEDLGYTLKCGIRGLGVRKDIIEQRVMWNIESYFAIEGY